MVDGRNSLMFWNKHRSQYWYTLFDCLLSTLGVYCPLSFIPPLPFLPRPITRTSVLAANTSAIHRAKTLTFPPSCNTYLIPNSRPYLLSQARHGSLLFSQSTLLAPLRWISGHGHQI
jgi:hypothetical protein